MKRDLEPEPLKSQLQAVQEAEDEGAQGALYRVPVSENDHGNGDPSPSADHIHEKHVLMSQGEKRTADPHQSAPGNQTERSGEVHIHAHRVRHNRTLPHGPDLEPDPRFVKKDGNDGHEEPGDVGQGVLAEQPRPYDGKGGENRDGELLEGFHGGRDRGGTDLEAIDEHGKPGGKESDPQS